MKAYELENIRLSTENRQLRTRNTRLEEENEKLRALLEEAAPIVAAPIRHGRYGRLSYFAELAERIAAALKNQFTDKEEDGV